MAAIAAGGKCVAPARLLRCAELSNISQETSLYLQEVYQVKNIIDLRSEAERKHAPDYEGLKVGDKEQEKLREMYLN